MKTLNIPNRLAPTPAQPPRYTVHIKNAQGQDVALGDPAVTRALVALMNLHAVQGGAACHWGGPAAFAEVMSAVHGILFSETSRPWYEMFNFINDAGHAENGLYALRANYGFDGLTFESLRGFRSLTSKLTGHGESHLNPEGVFLSNGPLGSAFPQSEGLALADKAAGRDDRVTICAISDGAAMEGEAREAFASIPGFAKKGKLNPYVLVLSDNNTKLSGRIDGGAFDMQPTFESLETLGWHVIRVENGHDLQAVYTAVETAVQTARSHPKKPVCVWLKTIKGYGVKATMESASGGHGYPLKDGEKIVDFVNEICGGNPPKEIAEWADELHSEWKQKEAETKSISSTQSTTAPKKEKIQAGIARALIDAARDGRPVFSITSDLQGSTGVAAFQKEFPSQYLDVGVAEANMVSIGAGFAKVGFIPVVDTFAQFGVTKGNLPLTMASLSQAPVIAVFSHTGFQDAADGASHQATTYFSAVSSIPNTTVIACSCSEEAHALMYLAVLRYAHARRDGEDGENVIFFIGRENFPARFQEHAQYDWGKPQVLAEGKDITLVTTGSLVGQTLSAAEQLRNEGIEPMVIHNPFVNRPDASIIGDAVRKTGGKLLTIEDHQVIGGMGALLVHELNCAGFETRAASLGIPGEFGRSAYKAEHLYHANGLSSKGIAAAAKKLLSQ